MLLSRFQEWHPLGLGGAVRTERQDLVSVILPESVAYAASDVLLGSV